MKKRFLSLVLALLILLTIIPFSAMATQSKKENFNKSYTLTDNMATDICRVAYAQANLTQSQLGYTENWCADFVSDCARLANIPTTIIGTSGLVKSLLDSVKNGGGKEVTNPQAGDLVFYAGTNKSTGKYEYIHVGIMVSATTSVQGNLRSKVFADLKPSNYKNDGYSWSYFYMRPNYSSSTQCTNHTKGTYAFYESAHPHYNYWYCSNCGTLFTDGSTNYLSNCIYCNSPIATYTVNTVTNLTETSAQINAKCSYTTVRPTAVGFYIGEGSSNNMTKNTKYYTKYEDAILSTGKNNPINVWYPLSGLAKGTTYYYKFYAIVNGQEVCSNTCSFTTAGIANPIAPTLYVTSTSNNSCTVAWNAVANATRYDVYLVQYPWAWADIKYFGSTTFTSYSFTNVTQGDYRAFVIARPNEDTVQSKWVQVTIHNYVAKTTPPTCVDRGYTTYTCSCGDTYKSDYTDPTGQHNYKNGKCSVCGADDPNYKPDPVPSVSFFSKFLEFFRSLFSWLPFC